ncbi:MAG: methyltransferase domain-containing protein [Candidatus Methanofastidiosia archaeon]
MSNTGFDRLYTSQNCVWGLKADKYLATFLDAAPVGKTLDFGCGEGRHSLFLAQNGYTVDAVDDSQEAINKLQSLKKEYGVSSHINAYSGNIITMPLPVQKYSLVIISYVLPFLKQSEIATVLEKAKSALKPKGCIYVSAITTDDNEYHSYKKTQSPVEPRTFYSPALQCYTYFFEPGELKTFFTDFTIIDYTETVVELSREPYTHAMCLLFARK